MKVRNNERVDIARRKRQFAAFLLAFIMAFMNFGTVLAWAVDYDIEGSMDNLSSDLVYMPGDTITYKDQGLKKIFYYKSNFTPRNDTVPAGGTKLKDIDLSDAEKGKYVIENINGAVDPPAEFRGWKIGQKYSSGATELYFMPVEQNGFYTVQFDTESGGAVKAPDTQYVLINERPAPVDILVWDEDHEFLGWFLKNRSGSYDDERKDREDTGKSYIDDFAEDVTLHAKWRYKVKYYENHNSSGTDKVYNFEFVDYGDKARKISNVPEHAAPNSYFIGDPVWDGHDFLGWFDDKEAGNRYFLKEDNSDGPEIRNVKNMYAHWTYNVNFDSDGGSEVKPDSQKINQGEKVTKPADPTKEGFVFKGWFLNDREYDFNTPVTTDITLKAKWEKPEDPEKKDPEKKDSQGDGDLYVPFDETGKLFQVAIVKRTDTTLKLSWNKVPGADRYVIYGRPCFHFPLLKIAEIKDPDTLTYVQSGLIKDKYYKYQLKAYKGKKCLAKTLIVHGTTLSDKNTVAGKIEITNVVGGTMEKTSASGKTASLYSASANSASANGIEMGTVRLKKKEKIKITAKEVPEESGKTIDRHRPRHNGKEKRQIEYQSTDKKVAKVTKTGLIKAKNTGECVVFANAQNGVLYRIRVIVE